MKHRGMLIGLALVVPFFAAGCELVDGLLHGGSHPTDPPGQPCTLIGCSDQVNITVNPSTAGTFADGRHEVIVEADGGAARRCTFVIPGPAGRDTFQPGDCEGGLMLTVAPLQKCTTVTSGNSVGQSCEPIPGKSDARLSVPGTPAKVHVVLKRDGIVYLDREHVSAFSELYPNGMRCGPVCRQSSVTWDF